MRFRVIPLMATAVAMVAACSAKSTAPAGTSTNNGSGGGTGGTGALTVVSSGASNGTLPTTYTCDGGSQSPPLAWSGAPSGTTGYAMIMTTIPSPGTVKYNWILYNIPATATGLPEGVPKGSQLADGSYQISATGPMYRGPGAGANGPYHHYMFEVYALDTKLSVTPTTDAFETRANVFKALQGHILGKAVYGGLFRRPS